MGTTVCVADLFPPGNYLLDYLAKNGPRLEPYVLQSIMRLLARITKHGWFDDPQHREITTQVTKFLQVGGVWWRGGVVVV